MANNIRKEMSRDADDRLPGTKVSTDKPQKHYPVNPKAEHIRNVLAQAKLARKTR